MPGLQEKQPEVCDVSPFKGLEESHEHDCFICSNCASLLRVEGFYVSALSERGKEPSPPTWQHLSGHVQCRVTAKNMTCFLGDRIHLPFRLTCRWPSLGVATVASFCISVLGSHSNFVHADCITEKRFLLHWKFAVVFPETSDTVT